MVDSDNGIYFDDDDSLEWDSRYKRNCFVYILLYGLLGGVSGITLNTMVSYLDIIAPKVITGLIPRSVKSLSQFYYFMYIKLAIKKFY